MNPGLPMVFVFGLLPWPDLTAGIESIKVAINKDCGHSMKGHHKVTQDDRGVVVWRVQSECSTEQKVLICSYPRAHPLICEGDPATAMISSPFTMAAAQNDKKERASIVCRVNWPLKDEEYKFCLYTGPANAALTCECTATTRVHELTLEVVP